MCGITGFWEKQDLAYEPQEIISCMTRSLSHRGPDDEGTKFTELTSEKCNNSIVAFGHRRLTIIDITALGRQPMTNKDDSIWLTFNGEIYNYIELRQELKARGYTFRSTSDTEVIIAAYEEWGTACFSRFNGMWALALFDRNNNKLILSRDRFGKKPLYYYKHNNGLVFASEIKALFKHPNVSTSPNYEKIFRYTAINYRYIDIDNHSFFKDIYHVPKGHIVEIDSSFIISDRCYWQLVLNNFNANISDTEAVLQFRDLLIDSVKLRLRSDVPVGCMLSGGLDSTSITCIAYKILNTPIKTFSGITGDLKGVYDESAYVDAVVRETDAQHNYLLPNPSDLFDTLEEMLYFHDEPVCTVTWYSLYLIAKLIRQKGIPVVLNGHGGDELAGGYWDHYHYNLFDIQTNGQQADYDYELSCWLNNHGRSIDEVYRTKDYITRLTRDEVSEVSRFPNYSTCFHNDFANQYTTTIKLPFPYDSSLLNRRLYLEMLYEGVPAVLRPEDRNTMATSVESRSPFLDYRLAEFCFCLPNRFKIRNGLGKWIIREAMKGILPEEVRTRKDKAGFIAPADEWFKTINRPQIEDLINSDSFADRGIFNVNRIKDIYQEHLNGVNNHQMFLWQLINIELWFRKFFD